jgi:hypothetical protein
MVPPTPGMQLRDAAVGAESGLLRHVGYEYAGER